MMRIVFYLLLCGTMAVAEAIRGQAALPVSGAMADKPLLSVSGDVKATGVLAYNSDGRFIAAVETNDAITVYSIRTGGKPSVEAAQILEGSAQPILAIRFGGSNTLVSVCADRITRIWNIKSGEILHTAKGNLDSVAAISPAAPLVASASKRGVRLCNYQTGELLQSFEVNDSEVAALAFTPDGKSLVIGSYKGVVRVIDVATWKVASSIDLDTPVRALAASADYVAIGYRDGTVALLSLEGLDSISELKEHEGAITALGFSRKGKLIASASVDGTMKVWDAKTHKVFSRFAGRAPAISVEFSPDGRELAACEADGSINFWDLNISRGDGR